MRLRDIIARIPDKGIAGTGSRPYYNHSVSFKKQVTARERADMLEKVGLNVFFFPSDMITGCDLLSDSGVTTMTDAQWAALHQGDEAYGSNRGYFMLMERIREVFGEGFFNDPAEGTPNAFLFHQGRACENALFTYMGRTGSGMIIPSNGHFDTTHANIMANSITPVNLFSTALLDDRSDEVFKGDMDVSELKTLLERSKGKIPLVYLTITNNTGGGQPVSMKNIEEVADVVHHYDIPLFFDACRFAENAWFIQQHEKGYKDQKIEAIVKKMFSRADGFTISFKKDGLVNMGGGMFFKQGGRFMRKYPDMPENILDHQILTEGHPTYGGMSGRDIMALYVGLHTVVKEEYLTYRINQVQDFGNRMDKYGLPVLKPIGGHAVYLDVNGFFDGTAMKPEDFGGISLCAVLLAGYGHRACELGYFSFGHYDQDKKKEVFPRVNFVRFAVPRLRYENQDLDGVVSALVSLYECREHIPAIEVTYGRELALRHFKARFRFKG
jgi:tryptophanase